MAITALPTAPSRADPSTFATRADAFTAALPTFVTEANATAAAVSTSETNAANSATASANSATASATSATAAANSATIANSAALTAGAVAWVSGTTYASGDIRYSLIDLQSYRRITSGAGTVDPSADAMNWVKAITFSGISNVQIFSTVGTTSWVCPAGITKAKVTVVGGGGSGSASASVTCSGAAGGTAIKTLAVVPGTSYTVTVGAGGAGVTNATGNSGAASSFAGPGISTITANGGSGGNTATPAVAGGTSTGGDINIKGGTGNWSSTVSSDYALGGSTPLSPASSGATTGIGGGSGVKYGVTISQAGAAGAVIIEY